MDFETVKLEIANGAAKLTLNRPDRLNSFTVQMHDEVARALDAIEKEGARALVLTGAGRGFCAGADISGGASAFDASGGNAAMFSGTRARSSDGGFVGAIYNCRKPSIAAINGAAVGVGITLCLPMDIRIASSDAKIGFVFARRGLVPEAGSAWFLPRLVGLDQALRWCLSGRLFDANEAKDGGLVSEVMPTDRLMARAKEIALEIAENTSPLSVAMTRHMLWQYSAQPHPFELLSMDGPLSVELGAGSDVKEGVAAFLEKRKPNFSGKVSAGMPSHYKPARR